LIFVTGRNKRSIEDHFDTAYELERELEERNKEKMLKVVREILPPEAKCVFIRQSEALGLGHAVLCAKPVVGDEPFAVLLADDLLTSESKPVLSQMADVYNFHKCPVLGVQEVPMEEVHQYGVVDAKVSGDRTYEVSGMVTPLKVSVLIAVVSSGICKRRSSWLWRTKKSVMNSENIC